MRSRAIVAVLFLLLGTASACDSGNGADPGGKTSPSPASSSAASSPAASASPSAPAPATGPVAELGHLRYRIPDSEGAHVLNTGKLHAVGSFHVDGGIYDIDGAEQSSDSTLDEAGAVELELLKSDAEFHSFRHTGNRTVAGQEVWVIEAKRKGGRLYEVLGVRSGTLFSVTFRWPSSYSAGRDVVESVLATVEWK